MTYIIFDETGSRYEVDQMEAMVADMTTEELETIYKSTSYFKRFEQYLQSLQNKGTLKELPHGEVNFEAVDASLVKLGTRIAEELGEETLETWALEVKTSWENRENPEE